MRFILAIVLGVMGQIAFAESPCDIRPGISSGVKVVEFVSGHVVHSKFLLKELSVEALSEEMRNLQDMGICAEKINPKKCTLKLERVKKSKIITLQVGSDRWLSWRPTSTKEAGDFVKGLKRRGFCS